MTLTSTTPSPASTTLPFLSMGANTLPVSLKDVFCANRKKLCAELREKVPAHSLVHFKGGQATTRYDSDHEPLFRQESYFLYLTGVKEPDVSVVIDVDSCQTTLFIPKLPQEYATIMGHIQTPDEWKQHYQVDNVEYVDDIESFMLDKLSVEDSATITNGNTPKLLLMKGINSDSGNMYEPPTITLEKLQSHIDTTTLFNILAECRVIKSPAELSILQYITEITSFAHTYVMRNTAPGKYEYQSESLFKHYLYYNYGCRNVGYTSICACGPNAAVLHYGHAGEPNSRLIGEGDMLLYDMGGELTYGGGYGSDVTCSFPASGKFTKRQAGIFEGVLNAQRAVYSMLKPGVSWVDCHKAAEAAILTQLVDIGIVELHEKTIEELVEMRLGAVFMPHGLGHFIGIDTHDVGGYLEGHPKRSDLPGLKSLRTARIMQESMTITVEPGCYFIDHLLTEALQEESPLKPYLNQELVDEYRGFGGVRLEDVVAVTKDGCVNYTLCPRTIGEVEYVMNGGKWPPTKDEAPELLRKRLTTSFTPLPSPPSL